MTQNPFKHKNRYLLLCIMQRDITNKNYRTTGGNKPKYLGLSEGPLIFRKGHQIQVFWSLWPSYSHHA